MLNCFDYLIDTYLSYITDGTLSSFYSRIIVCNPLSTVSIRTKTAAAYSITSSVSAFVPEIATFILNDR